MFHLYTVFEPLQGWGLQLGSLFQRFKTHSIKKFFLISNLNLL